MTMTNSVGPRYHLYFSHSLTVPRTSGLPLNEIIRLNMMEKDMVLGHTKTTEPMAYVSEKYPDVTIVMSQIYF